MFAALLIARLSRAQNVPHWHGRRSTGITACGERSGLRAAKPREMEHLMVNPTRVVSATRMGPPVAPATETLELFATALDRVTVHVTRRSI
jgi:hypothetical protein